MDGGGKEVEVDVKPGSGVLMYLGDFLLQVKSRRASHGNWIRRMEDRCPEASA